jgi:hypothetical protein
LDGSREVLVAGIDSVACDKDTTGQAVYINPPNSQQKKAGDVFYYNTKPIYKGEKILIEHMADTLSEAIDFDQAGEIQFQVMKHPKHGSPFNDSYRSVDTEIGADPTSSTSAYVIIWQDTMDDEVVTYMAGLFEAAAGETA